MADITSVIPATWMWTPTASAELTAKEAYGDHEEPSAPPLHHHERSGTMTSTISAPDVAATGGMNDETTFALFDWIDSPPGADQADVLEGRLQMIESADRGTQISTYHMAEHHGTTLGLSPSPSVFIAAAAQRTTRIRLAPTVFVLPLYDNLRLAQEIGMLDQLSRGRLDIGLGRGSVPIEGEFYGYSFAEMAKRYSEQEPALLETLKTGVYVAPPGEASHHDGLPLYVTTIQKPNPPLWYPTTNAESVPRLAKDGYNTLFGFAWFSPSAEEIGKVSDTYFAGVELAQRNGDQRYAVPGVTPRFGTMRHVFVAETDDEAVAIARPALDDFNNNFTFLMRRHNQLTELPRKLDFDSLRDNTKVIVGSVQTVVDRLVELIEVGKLNHFAGVFAWGSLTTEQTLASLGLYQSEVVPLVRAALAKRGHVSPVL